MPKRSPTKFRNTKTHVIQVNALEEDPDEATGPVADGEDAGDETEFPVEEFDDRYVDTAFEAGPGLQKKPRKPMVRRSAQEIQKIWNRRTSIDSDVMMHELQMALNGYQTILQAAENLGLTDRADYGWLRKQAERLRTECEWVVEDDDNEPQIDAHAPDGSQVWTGKGMNAMRSIRYSNYFKAPENRVVVAMVESGRMSLEEGVERMGIPECFAVNAVNSLRRFVQKLRLYDPKLRRPHSFTDVSLKDVFPNSSPQKASSSGRQVSSPRSPKKSPASQYVVSGARKSTRVLARYEADYEGSEAAQQLQEGEEEVVVDDSAYTEQAVATSRLRATTSRPEEFGEDEYDYEQELQYEQLEAAEEEEKKPEVRRSWRQTRQAK